MPVGWRLLGGGGHTPWYNLVLHRLTAPHRLVLLKLAATIASNVEAISAVQCHPLFCFLWLGCTAYEQVAYC